jgi:PAS domain S-box-containing protein
MRNNNITENREKQLLDEIASLKVRLEESEEILEAIQTGAVDALTVHGPEGPQIYTIQGADHTYRVLIEEMNEGALILNSDATILFCNSSFANFLQLPLEKVIGSTFYSFLFDTDHNRFNTLFKQGWQKSSKGEFILQASSKTVLPFSVSMSVLNTGDSSVLGIIVTDLSAEKEILAVKSQVASQNQIIFKKEEELQRQKQSKEEAERFRVVLEGIPQIAWTSTPEGKINYTNQFWHQYTNLSHADTQDDGWQSVLHPDDKEKILAHIRHCFDNCEGINIEARLKRASDNSYSWHIMRASPIRNADDEIILWVGTFTDIQDQKEHTAKIAKAKKDLSKLNTELNTTNEQLIRTNNDLDTFVYTASHDLKSPILNIEGLINTLQKKLQKEGTLRDDSQRIIEMINLSVNRFKATIKDLTEIVKVQKAFEEGPALVSFEECIKDVQEGIQDMIDEHKATIHLDITEFPDLSISNKNLKSVIYNLLSNAIKYRSPDRAPEVFIKTEKQGDYVLLTISDNGLGINDTDKNKIFEMFKRLHSHVDGTGIGLYIVKRIIENMGGKIEVESTLGQGSLFRIYLR